MSRYFFLVRRLLRYTLAEILYVCGNLAPHCVAPMFWQLTLALNPHHVAAALNRARALQAINDTKAWRAFQDARRAIENPQHTSASDLALTWVPGHLLHRIAQHIFWRDTPTDYLQEMHDRRNQDLLAHLARAHFTQSLDARDWTRARIALEVWHRTQPSLASEWANIELEFDAGNFSTALEHAAPLIEAGHFIAPLAPTVWAERWLTLADQSDFTFRDDSRKLAEDCLRWAETWTPELAAVWRLRGRLAQQRGNADEARWAYQRALALAPDDVTTFLALQSLHHAAPRIKSTFVRLHVDAPPTVRLGEQTPLVCHLDGATGTWTIHVLPPAGWGIVAIPRHQITDSNQRCVFTLRACRPHRIRGQAWTLTIVAEGEGHYATTQINIAVPDDAPGQILIVNTEDHEIWEERGAMSLDELRRLFITKSNVAAQRLHPLTQMIEVGSTLAMLDEAAKHNEEWCTLRDEVRTALVQNVAAGGDLQPHLHAFNDPSSPDFPYRVEAQAWSTDHRFLLTAEERRRDFARAFTPPERIARVAEVVAQIENLGRQGDANYRAVLWRTGQLELGDDANERAWSAVALLRAGLLADSDLRADSPACFASIADPFVPRANGELIQLPIWSNLEGNFLTDARALQRRVQKTMARWRGKPGVHLFTLLTHDKFINARRGDGEFRLDQDYGDWATMRAHLAEWRKQGATLVTAREGIARFVDDWAPRLTPMLGEEKMSGDGTQVRYTLHLLGKGIPVSTDYPQHVLVTIPPFLRDRVTNVRAWQGECPLPIEWNRPDCFWVIISQADPPIHCEFQLSQG